MFKKIVFTIILSVLMAVNVSAAERYLAKSMSEGNDVYFDCYTINGSYYFAVRDIAQLLKDTSVKFELKGSGENIIFEKGMKYNPVGYEFYKSIGKKKRMEISVPMNIICGENSVEAAAYNINDRCYIKLNDIASALGLDVICDNEQNRISINDESGKECLTNITVHEPVLYDKTKPMVALTFDDGPSKYTPEILNTLDKYGASATFFVAGTNASRHTDILKKIINSGCEIGNHTYSHSRLITKSDEVVRNEVNSVQNIVYNATGIYPVFLRPPYGEYNSRVKSLIGLKMINWSVDTLDWKSRNANSVYSIAMRDVKDGSVILMHDLYGSTAESAKRIVPELKRRGYQMVTLEQLYEAKGYLSGQIK